MPNFAADDFETIRKRIEELRKQGEVPEGSINGVSVTNDSTAQKNGYIYDYYGNRITTYSPLCLGSSSNRPWTSPGCM